jgi:membrane-bound lytic murein transglycosylase F
MQYRIAMQSAIISKTSLLNLIFTALCAISFSLHAETRDFNQIKASKTLRIITWSGTDDYLPRAGSPPKVELDYLQQFADENKLEVELVTLNKFDELIPALLAGKGDVIAANLSVTQQRKRRVIFTSSFAEITEYLVMAKDAKNLPSGKALAGREVSIQEGTAYAFTAQGLAKFHPKLIIRTIPGELDRDEIMDKVASGEYDLTILDSNQLSAILSYRDDIKKSLQASSKRKIAWAVRPGSKKLLTELNHYLRDHGLLKKAGIKAKTQWDRIQNKGTIRFVMRNNIPSCYIWRGEIMGFHNDIARNFAKDNKLRYELVMAPDNASLLEYIVEDKADIALGFLTPSQVREDKGVVFSRPYHYSSEVIVTHADDNSIETIDDLKNRTVTVRPSSSYWGTAKKLQKTVAELKLVAADDTLDTEEIIGGVADKTYDLTIADSHLAEMEINLDEKIKIVLELTKPQGQSWAVKAGNDALLNKVNRYIRSHYKGLFYNITYNKYFKNLRRIEKHHDDETSHRTGSVLSPYDDLVKKYSERYGFDYRLMVAQMHQESKFNPKAKSYAGAVGLFQVMPKTAKQMGFKNPAHPETGIHAGIRYMDWVRERMKVYNVRDDQLIWFTLAAYNAGSGHVADAIRLARKKGWRDDVWFGNVEKAMLLLSHKKYASKARYGYVRGKEPVEYVRSIKQRYEIYKQRT